MRFLVIIRRLCRSDWVRQPTLRLDVHLLPNRKRDVILQSLADAWFVEETFDAEGLEAGLWSNSGNHEKLWRLKLYLLALASQLQIKRLTAPAERMTSFFASITESVPFTSLTNTPLAVIPSKRTFLASVRV